MQSNQRKGAVMRSICTLAATGVALATGLAITSAPVIAQAQEERPDEVRVIAPREVTRELIAATDARQPGSPIRGVGRVELVSLTRGVSYADLDLAAYGDVIELQQRVQDTARTACDQLSSLFGPPNVQEDRKCLSSAIAGGMEQVRAVVDMASRL